MDSLLAPPPLFAIIYLLLGFAGLAWGAGRLLDGAVALAERTGLSHAVIGATVVAFGTSAPELVVCGTAAFRARWQGQMEPDGPIAVAVANAVGANIANLGLILGLVALIGRVPVTAAIRGHAWPAAPGACVLFAALVLSQGGERILGPLAGAVLLAWLVVMSVRAVRQKAAPSAAAAEAAPYAGTTPPPGRAWWQVASGLVLLLIAAQACLSGAVVLAEAAGMSTRLIGLTVVSLGTTLPELFASIQAARRGQTDLALGNVLGSTLCNIAGILALVALVVPLPINDGTVRLDLWTMLALCLLPGWWILRGAPLGRPAGILLVLGYVGALAAAGLATAPDA